MKNSNQKIRLWGGLAVIILLILVALGVSGQVFARGLLGEGYVVSTVVTPGLETTLTSPDGQVTLTFPTNFFSVTLVVTYTERAIADLPPNLAQIGPAFTLEAVRASNGQPVTIYEVDGCAPVGEPDSKDQCLLPHGGFEIVFHYANDELTSAGLSSDTLALAYHYTPDGIHGKWLPLTTVIDARGQPDDNRAVASTWYLTHFALLGLVPPVPLASAGQVEVIVDDLDTGFTQHQVPGSEDYWWQYWSEGGTYDGHSYYTKDSDPAHGRQNWGTWTPNLPESGTYEIWAFIPWNHATTTSTHYMVERDGSPIGTATINQLAISADWVSLGTYSLPAGTRTTVTLDDMTDDPGYAHRDIGLDALKFVCQDCGATPTPTPGPTPVAFTIQNVAAVDVNGNALPWDALVRSDAMLTVEVRGTGDQPPTDVWVQIDALQSGQISGFPLPFQQTVNGTHIYRGSTPAVQLVGKPDVMTAAAVVWDWEPSDTDYEIAEELMRNLGIPIYRRRGIAWGDGDQARNRPPANLDYFRAAGYEVARLSVPAYPGSPQGKFYVQNQADVLFYLGHGSHSANRVFLSGPDEAQGYPDLINTNDYWNSGLQTVIFFACSVLDINNYDGCADDDGSPGTEWIAIAGPETWLGFKWTAPTGEQGRTQIQKFVAEYVASGDWITAWQTATGDNTESFRHAVAIDDTNYYYWDCPISFNDPGSTGCRCLGAPTWETIPRTDLNASTQGLELLVASPVEVHVYDALGRHVGPNAQGGLDLEIPGAAYWTPVIAGEPHPDARRVSIPAGDLSHAYQITLVGTDTGLFDFYLEVPDRATGALYHADYLSVTVAAADTFALHLQRGTDFGLAADRDGDGVFEGQVAPSATSSREIDLPLTLVLEGTTGTQGWYRSAVVAGLHGSTRPGRPALTSAEVDLGSGWQPYTTPLTFTQEGTHTLHYRGIFAGGLQDVEQWVSFRLDTTPPVLTLTTPTAITYTLCPYTGTAYTGALTVTYQAQDTIAGLDWVSATLSGVAITNGQMLDTLFWPPGPHELVVTAQDQAGWQTVYRQPLFIQAQIEDLDCALDRLADLELIAGPEAETTLTHLHSTLAAAQAAHNSGDTRGAVAHLHTFILDMVAQSPAPISLEAARILVRGAQYVTNRLTGQIIILLAYGGQLTSPAFDVTVMFPANAITATTLANYRAITNTPPITLPRFSPVFELTALDYDSTEVLTHFQHPVTISITYGNGTVGGLGERWLALHTWESINHEWVMLPTTLDRSHDQATALVSHFSIYALLEQDYRSVFLPLVTRMSGGAQ